MAEINQNQTSNWNQTKYAKTVSSLLFTKSVAMSLANTELSASMPDGDTIVRATNSFLSIQQYNPNNTVNYDNLDLGNESLVINDTPVVAFTLDEVDDADAGWNIKMDTMQNVARLLKEYVDGKFFGKVIDFDNTTGTAVALTDTTAYSTASGAIAGLLNNGVDDSRIVLVMDAFGIDAVAKNAINSTFALADRTYSAGYIGRTLAGAELVRSENLTMIGSYTLGTGNPSNGQTVKLNGVTVTFVSTIGTTAGNVLIGADETATIANLNAFINKGAGAGTTYVDITPKNRNRFLRGFSSTASTTTLTFTSTRGYRGVSAFGKTTVSNNKFGQFVIYYAAMEEGAIHMVMRDSVKTVSGRIQGTYTYEYLTRSRFGLKVFEDGRERGIIIPVICRAAE